MKNTCKRTLALALAVVMLLSVSVIGVSAEETEVALNGGVMTDTVAIYEFWQEAYNGGYMYHGTRDNAYADIDAAYNAGDMNWTRYSESAGYSVFNAREQHEITMGEGIASRAFYGFLLKNPGVGTYDLSLEYAVTNAGSKEVKVFLISQEDVDAAVAAGSAWKYTINNDGNLNTKDYGVIDVGTFTCYNAELSNSEYEVKTLTTSVTLDSNTVYHLVFSANNLDDSTNSGGEKVYVKKLALEKTSAETGSAVDYNFFQGKNGTTISANLETLNTAWVAETLNWKFENAYNASYYGIRSWFYTKAAGLEQQMCKNGWLAIRIAAPGTGNYDVTVNYSARDRGASSGEMYIWEATETEYAEADITALVGAATAGTLSAAVTGLDWCATGSSEYETGRSAVFNYNFTEGKDYILAFKALATSTVEGKTGYANILLSSLYAAPKANNAATIGEEGYPTVKAALNAAEAEETVKLLVDCAIADLKNPLCNIDLNGKTLTVYGDMTTVATVSDSSEGNTGILKVTGTMNLAGDQAQLPLYDAAAGGYGLYSFAWGKNNQSEAVANNANARKFWFQLFFDNAKAYALIASGTSGLSIGIDMKWGEGEDDCASCVFVDKTDKTAATFAAGWGAFMQTAENPWLYVTVQNAVEGMTVTPVIEANGAQVACASIAY